MLNLKLSDAKRPLVSEIRQKSGRDIVLDGIQHQIALTKDQNYKVERIRYAKTDDGSAKKAVAITPKPWWWQGADGTMMVQIRYGHAAVVEIEAGKPTVLAGKTAKDVAAVLTQIAEAIKAGTLDAQIDVAKSKVKRAKKTD